MPHKERRGLGTTGWHAGGVVTPLRPAAGEPRRVLWLACANWKASLQLRVSAGLPPVFPHPGDAISRVACDIRAARDRSWAGILR